jgi:Ca-activated chloride channel family protein
MTFLSGSRLWLLLVPVALLAVYLLAQRARQRAVVRFTDVDLLATVAPVRPGWQRHVPAALLLATIALLTVGFARPAEAVRTPQKSATVVLALDTSASMAAADVSPDRFTAAKKEAAAFVRGLPAGLRVGLVTFESNAQVVVPATSERTAVLDAIDGLHTGAGTATADAIDLSLGVIRAVPKGADGKPLPAAVVLMSDGSPTIGRGGQSPAVSADVEAAAAKTAGVPIDTIAFGTAEGAVVIRGQTVPVPFDPIAMARIAQESGGTSFTARSASQLHAVYDQIGRAVGYTVHRHEVTAWFSGAALALAALAGASALVWSSRLV